MKWTSFALFLAFSAAFGYLLGAVHLLRVDVKNQLKTIRQFAETPRGRFEATGYTAQPMPDGRVEITFLRDLGPNTLEGAKGEERVAELRTIVLPSWMWAQVTAEAALKLGFEALEKAKKED